MTNLTPAEIAQMAEKPLINIIWYLAEILETLRQTNDRLFHIRAALEKQVTEK